MDQILHLKSFGARLRVKDGLIETTAPDLSGAGNHVVRTFAAHQVKTILIDRQTSVSSDALLLAQRHEVDIFLVSGFSLPQAFIAPLDAPPSILLWQRQLALLDTPSGLSIARHWLELKVARKIEWLSKNRSYRTGDALRLLEQTIQALSDLYARFKHLDLKRLPDAAAVLRGMEGAGSRLYLDTLARLLPAATHFKGRSRQPAVDLFNAALNYAYAFLYHWVEKALWVSGLNPYIGYLHTIERKQKSLLYDMVEAFRPWVDKVVFTLCSRKEIGRQHCSPQQGGLWLNSEGCRLVRETLTDRFNENEFLYHGRRWTLLQSITLEARRLAALLRRSTGNLETKEWTALDEKCADPTTDAPCNICYEDVQV